MDHTGKVIHKPEDYALAITHREEHIQDEKRRLFLEQHAIQAVGVGSIAFSVICCDDPETAERHTVAVPPGASAEDVRTIMEHHARRHANAHAAVQNTIDIARELAENGVACATCKDGW